MRFAEENVNCILNFIILHADAEWNIELCSSQTFCTKSSCFMRMNVVERAYAYAA